MRDTFLKSIHIPRFSKSMERIFTFLSKHIFIVFFVHSLPLHFLCKFVIEAEFNKIWIKLRRCPTFWKWIKNNVYHKDMFLMLILGYVNV